MEKIGRSVGSEAKGAADIAAARAHVSTDEKIVREVVARIKAGEASNLSVGLTRPFGGSQFYQPVHWLQVNNIHLEGNPTWQLG
jgi:hypothetical protein